LDHEVWDNAMEDGAVIVTALSQLLEVFARLGRVVVVELDDDGALRKLLSR
jgi:predicted nuclease of predicted toxin-antitoxin system